MRQWASHIARRVDKISAEIAPEKMCKEFYTIDGKMKSKLYE